MRDGCVVLGGEERGDVELDGPMDVWGQVRESSAGLGMAVGTLEWLGWSRGCEEKSQDSVPRV